MSDYRENIRRDRAADREQDRQDKAAALRLQAELRSAEDERRERATDRADERAEKARVRAEQAKKEKRRAKAERARSRAAKREKMLAPANVYSKATLALIAASVLASLPAQVMHFVGISWMLLPLPFALEGAAWVSAAVCGSSSSRPGGSSTCRSLEGSSWTRSPAGRESRTWPPRDLSSLSTCRCQPLTSIPSAKSGKRKPIIVLWSYF